MPDNPSISGLTNVPSSDGKPGKTATADDINDLFSELDADGDDKTPPKESKADKVDDKHEDKDNADVDDDEIKLKEEDEEIDKLDLNDKDDDLDIDAPPRKAEILKKYPDLFKDFKFLEKMLYRDRQYNELFGSFDDAKESFEAAENFRGIEKDLLAGNTKELLKGIKETDERAFNLIVDDYLPALHAVSKDAYAHVITNINKRLIMEMVAEAQSSGNEDLKQAALYVNHFIFGTTKFEAPKNLVDKTQDESESKVAQERQAFLQERFDITVNELQSQVDNTLRATISDCIDPKNQMSAYTKKNAVADAMKYLSSDITNDTAAVKNLDKLWRESGDKNFSKETRDRIKTFYLGRAKRSLKDAIIKARTEALKDSPSRSARKSNEQEEEEETPTPRKRGLNPGRTSQPNSKSGMKQGESVADFFARD